MIKKDTFIASASWFMCGLAVILAGLVLYDLISVPRMDTDVSGSSVVEKNDSKTEPDQSTPNLHKALIDKLTKSNRFVNPPPEPQPPGQVLGILGNKALFPGDQWFGVGDTVPPGAKVLEITVTDVTIEWKGEKRKLYPIQAAIAETVPPPPAENNEKKQAKTKNSQDNEKPPRAIKNVSIPLDNVASNGADELDWLDIPPHLKDYVMKEWAKLTDEQKAQARKMFEEAPPEQKDQMLRELEEEVMREQNR